MAEKITLPAVIKPEQVRVGMTVRIHQKIKELDTEGKEKERVQAYEGLVIRVCGQGHGKTMTVRKIAEGVGVEKIYPLSLPSIQKIEWTKMAKVRRAHLGYVRQGKRALKEEKNITL